MASSETSYTVETGYHLNGQAIENGPSLEPDNPAPPPLWMNPNRSKTWFRIGCVIAILDLSVMPIVYFYALRYGTSLSLQDSMLHSPQSS